MKNKRRIVALFMCLFMGIGYILAQDNVKISGRVVDENGEPIPGVNVVVSGTTNGTITDFDGNYQITAPTGGKLLYSFIGYKNQEQPINGAGSINVNLEPESKALDEIVAVGYGTQKKRDVVGSVASVSAEALQAMPVATVSEAMTGKMAGVSITTTEGDPDADVKIRVRGGGSITQDNSPLYIVDGFPVESISDIPASEIQSIDVLKDAFSTAIYGARGANGVVIVTTKGGDNGNVKVAVTAYWGQKKMANEDAIETLTPGEYVRYQYELMSIRDQVDDHYTNYFGNFQDIDLYDSLEGNDWIQQIFGRIGYTYNHSVNVSGGSDKVKWTIGHSYMKDKAIMVGSDFSRNNLNMKATYKPIDCISFETSLRYARTKVRGSGANSINDSGSNSGNGRLKQAVSYTPIPLSGLAADADIDDESSSDYAPPITSVYDNDSKRDRTNWNGSAAFSWDIVKGLKLRVEGGIDDYKQIDNRFYGLTTYYAQQSVGSYNGHPAAMYTQTDRRKIRNTNTIQYDFNQMLQSEDQNLNLLLGQEYVKEESEKTTLVIAGFPDFFDADMAWNFFASGNPYSTNKYYNPDDILFSFFGRANYDYKGKYSISATVRADGSSKFTEGNRWGIFPSAAAAWRISDENFMEGLSDVIDNLKIRYSFGTAGNNNIPSGQTLKTFSASTESWVKDQTVSWSAGKVLNNQDLTWETTYSNNLGIDFSFIQGLFTGSIEVYQNNTKDLLINFPVSGSGYDTQYQNLGETRNRGLEVTFTANILREKDYGVSISGNVSWNKNKILNLGGLETIESSSSWASTEINGDYRLVEGGKMGDMFGYVSDGRYEASDFDHYSPSDGWVLKEGVASNASVIGSTYLRPGAMKLKDLNGDGEITTDDRTVIGNASPKMTGGWSLNAYAFGFDFGVNFNMVYGNNIYNANKIEFSHSRKYNHQNITNNMALGKRWTNIDWNTGELVNDINRLTEMNKNTTMWSPACGQAVFSDWAVEDGSFIRLSSATLGYTIPQDITKKWHMDKLRFYITGTNLFCWTKYSGYDPEVDTRRATPLTPGVDYSAYPKSIGYVVGVNMNF
ncbi:MAG: TonB-dependent receptor [Bacteroidales bacterium]|nr:TonB-dependent receptor [Bacteroidales bacterium]